MGRIGEEAERDERVEGRESRRHQGVEPPVGGGVEESSDGEVLEMGVGRVERVEAQDGEVVRVEEVVVVAEGEEGGEVERGAHEGCIDVLDGEVLEGEKDEGGEEGCDFDVEEGQGG